MSLSPSSGEQIVQVANPDPFAKPVLRAPVLHIPIWMIATAQAFRWLWRLIRFIARHPVADIFVALPVMAWRWLGWPGARSPSGAVRRAGGCGGGCRGRPRLRFRTR
jgi:hypothetical protein